MVFISIKKQNDSRGVAVGNNVFGVWSNTQDYRTTFSSSKPLFL